MKYFDYMLQFQLINEGSLPFRTFMSLTILLVLGRAKMIARITVHRSRKTKSDVLTIQPHNAWLSIITFMLHWIHIIPKF